MSNEKRLMRLRKKLYENIPIKRYEHTLSVVTCAQNLAKIYKCNVDKVQIAALLHDCGREIKAEDSITYALSNGLKVNKIERLQPILLHARIGRLIAKKKYGVKNEQILEAIEHHTVGNPYICPIAMIVYIADMLADGRDFSELEHLRSLAGKISLEELMLACLHSTLDYLLNNGLFVHLDSIKTYNKLLSLVKKEKAGFVGVFS